MHSDHDALSVACKTYVVAVTAVGAVVLGLAVRDVFTKPPDTTFLLLAFVAIISGPLALRIPSLGATVSVAEGLAFAAALLFGPGAGIAAAALHGLAVAVTAQKRGYYRVLFNVAEPVLSIGVSSTVFYRASGLSPLSHSLVPLLPLLLPLAAMIALSVVLNMALAGTALWLEGKSSPTDFVRSHGPHIALNMCVSFSLAAMIVRTSDSPITALLVVLAPLLLVLYLSSQHVVGRLEDAHKHIAELQRLYDSTIETLAMAIDAKDQVTHGHIRRVQVLSTQLATRLGATPQELKALEAAALLHDLGKLAVPEHILNKPGKLTPAEYEQMKAHAGIGASILSAINFPFPVAPIVRHHHENWNGTGYPDRLSGINIPLGARILAVVDCYDALTSDRPYRRRLSADDAMEMIRARSGSAFDPALVDAFITVLDSVPTPAPERRGPLKLLRRVLQMPESRTTVPAEVKSKRQVRQFTGALRGFEVDEIAEAVREFVAAHIDDAISVLYLYDPQTDRLVGTAIERGAPSRVFSLGDGVTGWVGANRRMMANSDAGLDLGADLARTRPPLRQCVSAPIVYAGDLVAVLTVYAPYALSEPEQGLIETLADELGSVLFTRAAAIEGQSAVKLRARAV